MEEIFLARAIDADGLSTPIDERHSDEDAAQMRADRRDAARSVMFIYPKEYLEELCTE